jgi:hypothetical protein
MRLTRWEIIRQARADSSSRAERMAALVVSILVVIAFVALAAALIYLSSS